jgi:hypothetical protein
MAFLMGEFISIREYARRLNINEKAVRKAIGGGLIVDGYDKEAKKIIPETANAEWGYKHEVLKPRPGVSRVKTAEKMNAAPVAMAKPSEAAEPLSSTPAGIPVMPLDNRLAVDLLQSILITSTLPVGEAVRLREIIGAQQDKLKLAEAEGRLVAKDKVEKALFGLGSELKKALLNVPTRTVRDIMAARNEVDGINILTDEITAVLNTFGNLNKDTL